MYGGGEGGECNISSLQIDVQFIFQCEEMVLLQYEWKSVDQIDCVLGDPQDYSQFHDLLGGLTGLAT